MNKKTLLNTLQTYGLICHTFAFKELPEPLQSRITTVSDNNFSNSYLSLFANTGKQFWSAMQQEPSIDIKAQENPVDTFSLLITNRLLAMADMDDHADILYPGLYAVPLIALGEQAGWSTASPLGLGLHPKYGPWFAYRALVRTDRPLQTPQHAAANTVALSASTSACISCVSTPCVGACPGTAVSLANDFNVSACAEFRMQQNSTCKEQCHARNACPIGQQHRYSEEQRAYHMTHALDALVEWSKK